MLRARTGVTNEPKLSGWDRRRFLAATALVEAAIFAAIGLRHLDREAVAFAALFVVGSLLVGGGRRGLLGLGTLALLAVDTDYWMVTALLSNIQNPGSALSILQPLVLVISSTVVLIGVLATAPRSLRRSAAAFSPSLRRGGPGRWRAAAAVLLVGLAAEFALSTSAPTTSSGLAVRIQNATFSTTTLAANAGRITVDVSNEDLFWHTFTVEGLPVNAGLPNGGHKRITFYASAGIYTFYCAIPGHRQAGMVGTITVK